MDYYSSRKVNLSFKDAVDKTVEELKNEGFGVLTEIDVKDTLKKKLEVEFRNYRILGACNPPLAYQALKAEKNIGVMLPCNVIVQESDDGSVEISVINPMVAMQSVGNSNLNPVAEQVSNKLTKVLDNI